MLVKKTYSKTYCGWKGGWAAVVGVPTVDGTVKSPFAIHSECVSEDLKTLQVSLSYSCLLEKYKLIFAAQKMKNDYQFMTPFEEEYVEFCDKFKSFHLEWILNVWEMCIGLFCLKLDRDSND